MRRYEWTQWLDVPLPGGRVGHWLLAAAVFLLFFAVFALLRRLVVRRMAAVASRTETDVDDFVVDVLRRTRRWLLLLPAAYLASLVLTLPAQIREGLRGTAILSLLIQVALWALVGIDFGVERTRKKRLAVDSTSVALLGVLRFVGKIVLWTIVLLVALDNLGVDITALVTGLGVGGIAVALAVQNILGDLLASLSIVLDKPFVVGDAITVGEFTGTVESVGLKTTRLRSVNGEQIIFPNGDLLQSRIRNWGRLTERRVALAFGVVHGTPPELVEAVPGMIREAVESRDLLRFDRAHFKGFTPTALDFEAIYWVTTPDYAAFMDRQQAINLELLRRFEAAGIHLAAPTPAVIVEKVERVERVGAEPRPSR
ncbi:MAG TPA: mechanosensitive ion channel family protein [Thermoanaerobaculia bacterium]|nr:mechanosensitive ion channel family protein [Thermoanaerobaculia bacterium]